MLRKSIVLASVASLLFAAWPSPAQAQTDSGERFRAAGEIQAVDLSSSTFTLHTLRGEYLLIHVDGSTRWRSRGGEIDGLADLEAGIKAAVLGAIRDGEHLARGVAAAQPQDLPALARAAGRITNVNRGRDSFTIETRAGDKMTFGANARTRYFSRDGSVEELTDLERGMPVRVVYAKTDQGFLALAVQVGLRVDRRDRPDQEPQHREHRNRWDLRESGR